MVRYLSFLLIFSYALNNVVFAVHDDENEAGSSASSFSVQAKKFVDLPDEIILKIAETCPITDVISMARVSKNINDILDLPTHVFGAIPRLSNYNYPSLIEDREKAIRAVKNLSLGQVKEIKYCFTTKILESLALKTPLQIRAFQNLIFSEESLFFTQAKDQYEAEDILEILARWTLDQIRAIGGDASLFINLDRDVVESLKSFTPDQLDSMVLHIDVFFYHNKENPVSIGNAIMSLQNLDPDQMNAVGQELRRMVQQNPERRIRSSNINAVINRLFSVPDDQDD
jgi:hypothetical protein